MNQVRFFPGAVGSRAVVSALLLLAGWPVFRWYMARMFDGSDEPLGLAALAAALWFAPRSGWWRPVSTSRLWVLCALTGMYAASASFAPPLVRAMIWVTALALLVTPSGAERVESDSLHGPAREGRDPCPWLAWWTLLLLSLPLVATLQFYLGFPLRAVTTQAAALVLRVFGLAVTSRATVLEWQGEQVLIDAPCSGIQMLWTLLVVGAVLACARRLNTGETLRLFRRAGMVVFAANTLRAAALFCVELQLWPAFPWAHDVIGLTLFAVSAAVLLRDTGGTPASSSDTLKLEARTACAAKTSGRSGAAAVFCGLSLIAMAAPVVLAAFPRTSSQAIHEPVADSGFPGWSAAPLPEGLSRVELTARDRRFVATFPGQVATFSDGRCTWIVRWVARPTRKLHPSTDCLRAAGYAVESGAAWLDGEGRLWAGATATRGTERLRVRERVSEAAGGSWTDVSAWYWDAVLGRSAGPWWAVTVLEPVH